MNGSVEQNFKSLMENLDNTAKQIIRTRINQNAMNMNEGNAIYQHFYNNVLNQLTRHLMSQCYTQDQFGNPILRQSIKQSQINQEVNNQLGNIYNQMIRQSQMNNQMMNSFNSFGGGFGNTMGMNNQMGGWNIPINNQMNSTPFNQIYNSNQYNAKSELNDLYGNGRTGNNMPGQNVVTPHQVIQPQTVVMSEQVNPVIMPTKTEITASGPKRTLNNPYGHMKKTAYKIKGVVPMRPLTFEELAKFKSGHISVQKRIADAKAKDALIIHEDEKVSVTDSGTVVIPDMKLSGVYQSEETARNQAVNIIKESVSFDEYPDYVAGVTYDHVKQVNVPFEVSKTQVPEIMKHTGADTISTKAFASFMKSLNAKKVNPELRAFMIETFMEAFNEFATHYLTIRTKNGEKDTLTIDSLEDVSSLLTKSDEVMDGYKDFVMTEDFDARLNFCIKEGFGAISKTDHPFLDLNTTDTNDVLQMLTLPDNGLFIGNEPVSINLDKCFTAEGDLLPELKSVLEKRTYFVSERSFVINSSDMGPLGVYQTLSNSVNEGSENEIVLAPFNYHNVEDSGKNCRVGMTAYNEPYASAEFGHVEINLSGEIISNETF